MTAFDALAACRVAMTPLLRGSTFAISTGAKIFAPCAAAALNKASVIAPRIDGEIAVAEQRRRPRDAEALPQARAVEKAARQASGAPRAMLAHQPVAIEHVAREVEGVAGRHVGHAELAKPRRDGIDREPRAPPGARSIALADPARQLDQRRVDLVLHQGGAGRGRALGRAAAVHHHDVHALPAKRIGHHGAGDAGADHQHLGLEVARQRPMRERRCAMLLPDRTAGAQVL